MKINLKELERDIEFIKLELEKNLSDNDKHLLDTLIDLQNLKQKELCDLAYIKGEEAISQNIMRQISNMRQNIRTGGSKQC